MFAFRKKDKEKEKDKKEKKEKEKREKKEKKEKTKPLVTPEEMSRLEEVKKGVFRRFSDRDKHHKSPHKSDSGESVGKSDSSESNLSGSSGRPSPTKEVPQSSNDGYGAKNVVGNPPPILPKPKSILKEKSKFYDGSRTVAHNIDDTKVLQQNTRMNQEMSGLMEETETMKIQQLQASPQKPQPKPRRVVENNHVSEKNENADVFPDFSEKSFDQNLKLPMIKPPKPPRTRELVIKRTPAGDFGFSLRKGILPDIGAGGDCNMPVATCTFAEPGIGPKSLNTGLIPGDRLIEVNGINVETKTREEIVEMIKTCGETVTLRVQPIPELIELSVRPGKDGGTLDVQDDVVMGGTLKRSGSIRYKKGVRLKY